MANGNEQWSLTAYIATAVAILGPILTLLFTKGKDFLQMLRGESRTDKNHDQELEAKRKVTQQEFEIKQRAFELDMMQKGYEATIASQAKANEILERERKEQITHLNQQIIALLADLQKVRDQHRTCEVAQEGLRVLSVKQAEDIQDLQGRAEHQELEIDRLRTLLEKKNGST